MGLLLIFNGIFMLIPSLVSFLSKDKITLQLSLCAILTLLSGVFLMIITLNHIKQIQKHEGYIIVSLGWIFMSISGALPYIFTNITPSFSDAFFESVSGYTTTGASIFDSVESLPKSILFWRSITHWIGGMGIIVLAIAILPLLGIGGMQLFTAESPGPNNYKLHPRITDTAKRLWLLYLGYTILETLLLTAAGMSFFDALNHAMSTISTGGFSTKNNSIAHWNHSPLIQYIIIVFMIIAGSNFILSYFAFTGKIKKIIQDKEFLTYLCFIFFFSLIVGFLLFFKKDINQFNFQYLNGLSRLENSFRHGFFQVVSIVTTTGFSTSNFTIWTSFLTTFFFGLMFLGGSAGSTAGGVKVIRHLLMIKNGFLEFKRILYPNSIIPVRYNNVIIDKEIIYNILGFFILYMLSFIVGALGFGLVGLSFTTSIGVAASFLGNVGPAIGNFIPSESFSNLPLWGKWWGTFLMLIGRLELFTVLILLTPFFWKKHY